MHRISIMMATIHNVDVSRFYDQLFCLKRDFHISNLPELHAIRTVSRPNSDKKHKVTEVHLFNPEGEMFILEMWNKDATDGVKYLWELLGDEEEILLRFQDLDPEQSTTTNNREASFKFHPVTSFQRDFKAYPVKLRMYNRSAKYERFCHLSKQCTRIRVDRFIQLMNGKSAMRDISLWDQTIERQEQADDPDELQQLIYQATAISPLGKRGGGGETSTQADKGNKVTFEKQEVVQPVQKKHKGSTNSNKSKNTHKKKDVKVAVNGNDMEMISDKNNDGGDNSPSSNSGKMDTEAEDAYDESLTMVSFNVPTNVPTDNNTNSK